MTRRKAALALSMPLIALGRPVGAPTDLVRLMAFSLKYNKYLAQLKAGRIDLDLWEEVDEQYHKLY